MKESTIALLVAMIVLCAISCSLILGPLNTKARYEKLTNEQVFGLEKIRLEQQGKYKERVSVATEECLEYKKSLESLRLLIGEKPADSSNEVTPVK